jgi:hypothetical protein
MVATSDCSILAATSLDMALLRRLPQSARQAPGFTPAGPVMLLTYLRIPSIDGRSERLLLVTHIHTMSPLNRTAASRFFAVASRPAFSRQAPRFASNQSFVAPNSAEVDNIQSSETAPAPVHLTKGENKGSEPAVQNTPSHAPNYGAAVDYRTSAFSPVPKRIMDGSEPTETVAAAVLSGAPSDLQARTVRFVNACLLSLGSGLFILTP